MDTSSSSLIDGKKTRTKKAGLVNAVLLLTVAVLIGFAGAAGGSANEPGTAAESDSGEWMTDIYHYEATDGPVSAEQLWLANLAALECFEKDGFGTEGPWPSADGSNVEFSIGGLEGRQDALPEPDHACFLALTPLTMRFAGDDVDTEKAKLVDLRSAMEACLTDAGVTVSEGVEAYPNAGLQRASEERPEVMRSCANDLAP